MSSAFWSTPFAKGLYTVNVIDQAGPLNLPNGSKFARLDFSTAYQPPYSIRMIVANLSGFFGGKPFVRHDRILLGAVVKGTLSGHIACNIRSVLPLDFLTSGELLLAYQIRRRKNE